MPSATHMCGCNEQRNNMVHGFSVSPGDVALFQVRRRGRCSSGWLPLRTRQCPFYPTTLDLSTHPCSASWKEGTRQLWLLLEVLCSHCSFHEIKRRASTYVHSLTEQPLGFFLHSSARSHFNDMYMKMELGEYIH